MSSSSLMKTLLVFIITLNSCNTKEYEHRADIFSGEEYLWKECDIHFLTRKYHGECVYYHKDGAKMRTREYQDGEIHGKEIEYDLDGQIANISYYNNGNLEESVSFYENGELSFKYSCYLEDGSDICKETEYTKKGVIKGETHYKDYNYHGERKKYHTNGVLWYHSIYSNGCLENIVEVNDSLGNKLDYGDYESGSGLLRCFHPDGQVDHVGYIKDYFQVGKWSFTTRNGRVMVAHDFDKEPGDKCNYEFVVY